MNRKKLFLALSLFLVSLCAYSAIDNIAKIMELSESGNAEYYPRITPDQLKIYYLSIVTPGNDTSDSYIQASRASLLDPFSNKTTAPFTNIMSATSAEGCLWVSSDGLRLYFDSDREGVVDIFFSSRISVSDPFGPPSKITEICDNSSYDYSPTLANNELSIYFTSSRSGPPRIYRATRTSLSNPFSAPELIDEISYDYSLLDISNDELTMLFEGYTGGDFYESRRNSTSEDFPTPTLIQTYSGLIPGASMNSDWTRIYFSYASAIDPFATDLYSADYSNATPTPTPTPVFLLPVPDISLAANKNQIASFLGTAYANPYGGAFDSQGRYIFFDQMVYSIAHAPIAGSNQLLRMTTSGGSPSFEVLATASDLAAADSRWTTPGFSYPYVASLDVLSDDSVVLNCTYEVLAPTNIIQVVPGAPPTITKVAEWGTFAFPSSSPSPILVDKTTNPNTLYFAQFLDIYKLQLGQGTTVPTKWYTSSTMYIYDMVLSDNGNIIFSGAEYYTYRIYQINKTSKAVGILVPDMSAALGYPYYSTIALTKNPVTGDIFGVFTYVPPGSLQPFHIYKLGKIEDDSYDVSKFIHGFTIFDDPDVVPYRTAPYPVSQIAHAGNGMDIDPTGQYLFYSNGRLSEDYTGYNGNGSCNIIRIAVGSIQSNVTVPWQCYE